MRFPLTLFVLSATTGPTMAQATEAPPAARAHFEKKYPDAQLKEWENDVKYFKADFKLKSVEYDAYYTPEGAWVRTEHDIPKSALPAAVTSALKAGPYATWKIDDVEEHATPEHPVLYKVRLETETKKAEVFITPEGTVVRDEAKAKKSS